jgi:hypothetical protein
MFVRDTIIKTRQIWSMELTFSQKNGLDGSTEERVYPTPQLKTPQRDDATAIDELRSQFQFRGRPLEGM